MITYNYNILKNYLVKENNHMKFADEIRQRNKSIPESRVKYSDEEVYDIMLNHSYMQLKGNIRNDAQLSGFYNTPQHHLLYDEVMLFENRNTTLYQVIVCTDDDRDRVDMHFKNFVDIKFSKINSSCMVTLTEIGKRITDDLINLFKADGVKVWFTATVVYKYRFSNRHESADVEFGVKTKLESAGDIDMSPCLRFHYEII